MVLLRSQVQEWVQPKPTVTNGEAVVSFANSPTVSVSGLAVAVSGIACIVASTTTCLGSSKPVFEGDCEFFLNAIAGAVIDVDGSSLGNENTHYPACVATVSVACFSDDVSIIGDGWAGVFFGPECFPVVPQLGSASISIDYVGGGSTPIFPFRLPVLFMTPGLTAIDGAAFLDFDGDGVSAAAGMGFASLPVLSGDAAVYAGVIGDNSYAVYGVAAVSGSGVVAPHVAVDGVGGVSVEGSAGVIIGGVLPTVLPFVFV